jgi:endonuclease YncB( thermonuclease family)
MTFTSPDLYVYRASVPNMARCKTNVVLDLGFGVEYVAPVTLSMPGNPGGRHIRSWLAERGNSSLMRVSMLNRRGKAELLDGDDPPYLYWTRQVRVIDDDTMEALLMPLPNVAIKAKLRLAGLNVAEKNTERGANVAARVQGWIDGQGGLLVQTAKNHREKYGRMLATVRSALTGASLNELLLDSGAAEPYDGGARVGA